MWKNALVVHVLRKKVSFKALESKLHHGWEKEGWIHVDLSQHFYVLQFLPPVDFKHTLFYGHWLITDHYWCNDGTFFPWRMSQRKKWVTVGVV